MILVGLLLRDAAFLDHPIQLVAQLLLPCSLALGLQLFVGLVHRGLQLLLPDAEFARE